MLQETSLTEKSVAGPSLYQFYNQVCGIVKYRWFFGGVFLGIGTRYPGNLAKVKSLAL